MGAFRQAITKHSPDSEPLNSAANGVVAGSGPASKNDTRLRDLLSEVKDNRLRRILEMIESHPACRIQRLALECNLSESRLQHLFKQCTGLGLGQLLTEQRLLQATDFLVHTNMSIKEIAVTVGYEHASSFTRAFERRFREAPSCYREAHGSHTSGEKIP
ncbi:MAG: AraC family transcriptional regulator [Candidatus Sulfotelmatobacter sp.]|jgi:transcriptional regulator GlxA family with amidase domain